MTFQPDEGGFSQVCPHLGLADDADSHATYSTEAHRCYNLPNPTKIALPHQETYCLGANHVTCPVFQGQGVPAARPVAPAPVAAPDPFTSRPAQPQAPRRPAPKQAEEAQPFPESVPARRRPPRPPSGPRPRGGGVSMPVATIGLFVLAVAVIALAFVVTQLAGGGDDDDLTPAEVNQTRQAERTATPASATTSPGGAATTPAGGNGTPASGTQPPATSAPTSGPGGETYVIQPGDTCIAIAQANGVDLQDLLDANGMVEEDCLSLDAGDELTIP